MKKHNSDKDISPFWKKIGERINTLIAVHDTSQKVLADHLEVKPNVVSDFCHGKRTPNTEQIVKIADFFNVSADYLLNMTNIQTTNTDLQAVCKYTGLSEAAVKRLRHIWHKDYNDFGELNDIYLSIVSDMIVHGEFEEVLQLIHVTKSRRDNAGNNTDDNEEEQVKRILEENRDMLYAAGYLFVHKDKYDRMMKQEIKDKLGDIANSIIDK